jgi:hypothetical protein
LPTSPTIVAFKFEKALVDEQGEVSHAEESGESLGDIPVSKSSDDDAVDQVMVRHRQDRLFRKNEFSVHSAAKIATHPAPSVAALAPEHRHLIRSRGTRMQRSLMLPRSSEGHAANLEKAVVEEWGKLFHSDEEGSGSLGKNAASSSSHDAVVHQVKQRHERLFRKGGASIHNVPPIAASSVSSVVTVPAPSATVPSVATVPATSATVPSVATVPAPVIVATLAPSVATLPPPGAIAAQAASGAATGNAAAVNTTAPATVSHDEAPMGLPAGNAVAVNTTAPAKMSQDETSVYIGRFMFGLLAGVGLFVLAALCISNRNHIFPNVRGGRGMQFGAESNGHGVHFGAESKFAYRRSVLGGNSTGTSESDIDSKEQVRSSTGTTSDSMDGKHLKHNRGRHGTGSMHSHDATERPMHSSGSRVPMQGASSAPSRSERIANKG